MRILQIYDHLGMSNGINAVLMNWLRNIDREKIQIDFLIGYHRMPSFEEEIKQYGSRIFYMSDSAVFGVKQLPGIARNVKAFMKEHARDYDAVHLHTTTFSYPYLYYAKKYGVKRRICHVHSVELGNTKFGAWRNKLLVWPLKYLANEFVACSKNAGIKYYTPLGIKKFETILNGINLSQYSMAEGTRQQLRTALGVEKETFLVCHISNMTQIKNVPFVVQVFARIAEERPNSRLLLVGKDVLPEAVTEQIHLHGVADRIINLGVRSDVPALLEASDVCLMPSKSEGLGMVAIESQAAGTPVLTSTGFPEEIYATELAVRAELAAELWAQTALKQIRKDSVQHRENLKRFDVVNIAEQVSNYYLGR